MLAAETAYNFLTASLSPTELERLINMFNQDKKPKAVNAKQSNIWTVPECTEILLKLLRNRTKKRMQIQP